MSLPDNSQAGPSTISVPRDHAQSPSDDSSTPGHKRNVRGNGKGKAKTDGIETESRSGPEPQAKAKVKSQTRSKPIPQPVEAFTDPGVGEEETVHEVYERIAPHFSQTRYKPWPLITNFLSSLPRGSIGLDSGAGNGKYIPTAADAGHSMIALDRSLGLLEIAQRQRGGGDVIRGDLGARCWRAGVYDFVISVAAIHHLSTPERRRQAVQALLPCLRLSERGPYARFFIYVWAYEQGSASKRAMGSAATPSASSNDITTADPTDTSESSSTTQPAISTPTSTSPLEPTSAVEPAGNGGKIQDVLVPWVLKAKAGGEDVVHHRYYHLFVKGELRQMVMDAAVEEGYRILPDLDPKLQSGAVLEENQKPSEDRSRGGDGDGAERWLRIRGEGWEADNWWIEAEVGTGPEVTDP